MENAVIFDHSRSGRVLNGPWLPRPSLPIAFNSRRMDVWSRQTVIPEPVPDASDAELALQEVCHRIANQFATLNSNIRLRGRDFASQEGAPDRIQVLLLLDTIGAHVDALAKAHRALATVGTNSDHEIGADLHECLLPFKSEIYGKIGFTEAYETGCLEKPARLLAISQIVVEAVTNAIKYARADRTEIAISCRKSACGGVEIEVMDNGPGLPDGFDPYTSVGLGFRLMRMLSRSLDASIRFDSSSQGVHFHLSVPAKSGTTFRPPLLSVAATVQIAASRDSAIDGA